MAIRLVVADGSSMHCKLLADAMERDGSIEVVAIVSSSRELLSLPLETVFDIALLAPPLGDHSSSTFETVRELRLRFPHVRVIVILDSSQNGNALESLRAGVRGIFSTSGTLQMLCKCIQRVHEGQIWASSSELASFIDAVATAHHTAIHAEKYNLLSKREKQVLLGVAEGRTNHDIGRQLGVSRHTVKNHMQSIFEKLGASNRVELLLVAMGQGPAGPNHSEPNQKRSAPLTEKDEAEE